MKGACEDRNVWLWSYTFSIFNDNKLHATLWALWVALMGPRGINGKLEIKHK